MPEVRLIDANALMEKVCGNCQENYCVPDSTDTVYGCELADIIDQMPTIDAEPVRHGRWIFVGEETTHDGWTYRKHKCSECDFVTVEAKNFCQNCGARMDATDTNVGGKGDEEMDLSPLDFLAAEYDRKHPQGIRFADCMEGADDGACKKV